MCLHTTHASFSPPKFTTQTASRLVQPLLHGLRQCHQECLGFQVLCYKNCPFTWGSGLPSNICFLGPPKSITQTASQSIQSFLQSSLLRVLRHVGTCSFPLKIALPVGDLDPISNVLPWVHLTQHPITASRSLQPFLHSSWQTVPILYNGRPFSPKLPLPMGDLDPHLLHGSLGLSESSTQTSSGSVQLFLQGSLL